MGGWITGGEADRLEAEFACLGAGEGCSAEGVERFVERALGVRPLWIKRQVIRSFVDFHGYAVSVPAGTLFVPDDPEKAVASAPTRVLEVRQVFLAEGWVPPCFICLGAVRELANELGAVVKERRHCVLEAWLWETYTPGYVAAMHIGRHSQASFVSDFNDQIEEAIIAFYLGLRRAAVAVLVPVIEGVIARIADRYGGAEGRGSLKLAKWTLKNAMVELIREGTLGEYVWAPSEFACVSFFDRFDERVQIVRSLHLYFERHLYQQTDRFAGRGELNRHGILHGLMTEFDQPYNFHKLFTILDTLVNLAYLLTGRGSVFFPEESAESRDFAARLVAASSLLPLLRARPTPVDL